MDVTKKTDEVIEKTEDAEAPDTEPTEDTGAPDTGTPDSGVSEDMSLYQKKQKRLSLLNGIALGMFALCMVVMQAMSLLHIDVIVDGKYAGALLMPVIFIPLALMLVRGILSVRLAGKHKQSSSSDALVLVLTAAVTLVFGVLTVMYMNGENSRNQELVCENLTLREGQPMAVMKYPDPQDGNSERVAVYRQYGIFAKVLAQETASGGYNVEPSDEADNAYVLTVRTTAYDMMRVTVTQTFYY